MPRLLLILLVALGAAAIWRRKELRNDAERASKVVAGAADSATSRLRPDSTDTGDDADADASAADDEESADASDDDDSVEEASPAS